MSTIVLNLSEYITKEQILMLNELIDKVASCGNDHLAMKTTEFSNINLYYIKKLIKEVHCTDGNKTLEFVEEYRGDR